MFGFISYDSKGKGAVQKITKIRLDVIEGNVNSYSKFLNDMKIFKSIKDFNQLYASVAQVSEEVEQRKVQIKERKETKPVEKSRGKAVLDAKEVANKAELLPLHTAHALKYKDISDKI